MVTDFWSESAKIGIPPPSFCALVFHNGWEEDRNVDERANTDRPMYVCQNSVNFGPVTPTFCRRIYTGRATAVLCHAFLLFLTWQ